MRIFYVIAVLLSLCPVPAQEVVTARRRIVTAGGCTLPLVDTFSGTGAIGSNYTVYSGFGGMNLSSGKIIPATSGGQSLVFVTCNTFTTHQSTQANTGVFFPPSQGGNTALLINCQGTNFTCYVWFLQTATVGKVVAGTFSGSVAGLGGGACPGADVSHDLKLSNDGSGNITCADLTAGTHATSSSADTTFTGGTPGLWVDQTTSTNANFSATMTASN